MSSGSQNAPKSFALSKETFLVAGLRSSRFLLLIIIPILRNISRFDKQNKKSNETARKKRNNDREMLFKSV